MKENEKKADILVKESAQNDMSNFSDEGNNPKERLKKPLIFALMSVVFVGCMYLIFKPSPAEKEKATAGLNDVVPQATEIGLQADKQKAYEQEMLEQKNQEKSDALTSLSDYWDFDDTTDSHADAPEQDNIHDYYNSSPSRYSNPGLNSYRNAQSTLTSFYQDNNDETQELKNQIEELRAELADKEVPVPITVDDQLDLMEKSYQIAAKYLPSNANNGQTVIGDSTILVPSTGTQKEYFVAFTPVRKAVVSALLREPADSTIVDNRMENRTRVFYTADAKDRIIQPKNSVKASVLETQTIVGESGIRLRLLETAKTPNRTIPPGTILLANGKFQSGRLQLSVTSIELEGNIIPVDITVYDLDGQQGLSIPYSPEMNALTEMAGNMSQTSGTSLMLTRSAGQQVAADLSRGVIQGISGYFSKKVKTPKVTLKAGHQVFLVSKI